MNRRLFLLLSAISPIIAKDFITTNDDLSLTIEQLVIAKKVKQRLSRVKRHIGYANFNIISFNDMLYFARNYSTIGKFTQDELNLIEKLFYIDPNKHGFYGDKTISNINNTINKKDLTKISNSGHFVYKGKPLEDYNRIIKDVGSNLILTSGVRNVVKQLDLYLYKLIQTNGSLTNASRVIAPPAYSYHTISDFDVGKKGWGYKNFTSEFAKTKEFFKIRKLNYVGIRYTKNNKDGVRFEPWHVKVI
jgi:hypothetical protein